MKFYVNMFKWKKKKIGHTFTSLIAEKTVFKLHLKIEQHWAIEEHLIDNNVNKLCEIFRHIL